MNYSTADRSSIMNRILSSVDATTDHLTLNAVSMDLIESMPTEHIAARRSTHFDSKVYDILHGDESVVHQYLDGGISGHLVIAEWRLERTKLLCGQE